MKYVFIDEVSMISCTDLYKISAQLALLRNEARLTIWRNEHDICW